MTSKSSLFNGLRCYDYEPKGSTGKKLDRILSTTNLIIPILEITRISFFRINGRNDSRICLKKNRTTST
jgi:hypothetical protein